MFKVGDKVHYFRNPETTGTVYQVEGGREGDMTEVFWPHANQATWLKTMLLERSPE